MRLLEGKKGLILNIANDRSIAWHIGVSAIAEGAECGFGYLPIPARSAVCTTPWRRAGSAGSGCIRAM